MEENNISVQETCRRLDFEESDDLPISSEAQAENHEDKIENQMGTDTCQTIDAIHACIHKELIPEIGMEFETEDDAHQFYLSYAKAVGFGVRISKLHKDKETDHVWDRVFCCSREGGRKKDIRDASVKKHRPLTRCHCSAKMKISCRRANKYRIVKFIAEHNHACVTPSKSHLFRSHRRMTKAQKAQVAEAISCGIAQRETMELLAKQVGGREHLGFISDDCKNYLRSKRTNAIRSGDAGGVLQYLQRKHAEDPNFISAIQLDEDDLITNIFWADAKMRSDYLHFGDVVSFDTTYRKHKDGRPIALFVGINNHKQSIIFGVALLYDETAVTFSWLFDTFATTMSGKKPLTILTDQDKAMSKALASQWPETYHRLCVWHINQNAAIHLSNIFVKYKDFAKDFSSCMFDHEDVEDFINAWDKMIETYGLQENEWLKGMFKIREKWALVYGRETFCGDMITTQRSESMNSVIKKYISYKNELVEFFENFEVLLKDRRYKEFRADFSNSQSTPSSSFVVRISIHAAKVYTQTVYELFHVEVCKSHDCSLEISGEKDTIVEFKVQSYGKNFQHRVTYDVVGSLVNCSCKKFEFAGILCSHALKVLNFKQIVKIPDQYIKKRWMKTAKKQNVRVDFQNMSQVDPRESLTYRYRDLCQYYNKLIARAAESKNRYEIAMQGLEKLLEEVDACSEDDDAQDQGNSQTTDAYTSNPLGSTEDGDPSCKKVQGIKRKERITYKTSKRPKSCLEKPTRRRRSKTNVPRAENENLRGSNEKLGLGNKDPVKESHSVNGTNYSLDMPYSIANMHLNQNSCGEGLTQPEFDVSLSSTNSFTFLSSIEQEPESSFTDLLKTIDPGLNDQHVSMGYNSEYLRQPQNGEQGDWVKK